MGIPCQTRMKMKVYKLEKKLISKLKLMADRCKKKDVLFIIEGSEGEGKTNASEVIAWELKKMTGRPISMFFRLRPMIEFAKSTKDKIIIWDEPALDSLSTDWYRKTSRDLIRLLMTCRKKRHIFIFNFVKFYKFSEYVVVDRAHGFLHIYTRSNGQQGRFMYVRQRAIEKLYNLYRDRKIRGYKKFKSFGGWLPLIEDYLKDLDMTIEGKPHCTLKDYEDMKDAAIDGIGEEEEKKPSRAILQRDAAFFMLCKEHGMKQEELSKRLEQLTGESYNRSGISNAIRKFS